MIKRVAAITGALVIGFYSTLFRVDDIQGDTVTFIDCNGNTWLWNDADDIDVDDYFTAVMDANGTEGIYDDSIVSIRYERLF